MKKFLLLLVSMILLSLTVSCTQQNEEAGNLPKMVEVELSINPATGEVNKPISFEATVTQGNEKINDADVVFEVWRANDKAHEKIAIKDSENGVYRLEKTFQQEGTYYIISHVTARDMHNMPKKEFIVGTPSEPEDSKSTDSMDGMNMDEQNESTDGQ